VLVIEDGRIVEDGDPKLLAQGQSRYRELLDAETKLRKRVWRGPRWRRLAMHEGRLQQAKAAA